MLSLSFSLIVQSIVSQGGYQAEWRVDKKRGWQLTATPDFLRQLGLKSSR